MFLFLQGHFSDHAYITRSISTINPKNMKWRVNKNKFYKVLCKEPFSHNMHKTPKTLGTPYIEENRERLAYLHISTFINTNNVAKGE